MSRFLICKPNRAAFILAAIAWVSRSVLPELKDNFAPPLASITFKKIMPKTN